MMTAEAPSSPPRASRAHLAKYCAIIPTYDNRDTLEAVVERVRRFVPHVIVVDDGSGPEARAVARGLAEKGLAEVHFRERNGGKGAAVMTGLEAAHAAGKTHALQIDADGQHDAEDIPRFLDASKATPRALVLGQPVFDATAPKARLWGRKLSVFWCMVETTSTKIGDPLCGFRIYPVAAGLAANPRGRTMDFDPEIAVRLVWDDVPVVHVRTRVRYFSAAEGGVSHYRGVRDTLLIARMHFVLVLGMLWRVATWPVRRRASSRA
jgi:glycosyltransferase involved in cell wall biosynthesis